MQEIKDLKTRDYGLLCLTLREMADISKNKSIWDVDIMLDLVKKLPVDTYIIRSRDRQKWVYTSLNDEDLVYQEFFQHMDFVIVETDICMALARGLHYRYHKKVRP